MNSDQLVLFNYSQLEGGAFPRHQKEGIEFLLDHPKALLADDVGLGKTVQTAALLAALKEHEVLGAGLILAPAHLIPQWQAELARWVPSLRVAVTAAARPNGRDHGSAADVLLMSYESALSRRDALVAAGFSTVVLEEASNLKGAGPEQRAVWRITEAAERIVALTATPLENDLTETYAILQTLHLPGLWGLIQFNHRFVRWSEGWRDPSGHWVERKPIGVVQDALPEFRAFLGMCCLRRTASEVGLRLPVRVGERIRWLPPTPQQRPALARAQTMPAGLGRHHAMERAANVVDGRSAKAEAAVRIIVDKPGEKVVVWAFHKDHLDVLTGLLDEAGIGWVRVDGNVTAARRAKALGAFHTDPAIRVLVGTDAFASGLNLQHASVMISLGCSYNPGKEAQREGRIRRIGSPHATFEHIVLLSDTAQERQKVEVLLRKGGDAEAVLG